jgi:polysaccharide export outer membrane protein
MIRRALMIVPFLCTAFAGSIAQNGPTPAAQESYRLQNGDSFEVLYRLSPEYNQTVSVQPDGAVTLTLLGPVPVRGLTLEEARNRIVREASKRFNHPEVSLTLKDYVKPHFTVLGEVGTPGRFELRGSLSPADALAIAGGLKQSARHNNILLIHRINQTVGETTLINFKALEKASPGQELTSLRDGDIIIVPQSKLSKVERYVKVFNTGVYYTPTQ